MDSDDSVNALTDGISAVTMNGNSSSVFYPSIEQLESGARKVCEAAVAMVEHSYAPYSKFRQVYPHMDHIPTFIKRYAKLLESDLKLSFHVPGLAQPSRPSAAK